MHPSRSALTIIFVALLLAAGLVLTALANTERGPLFVYVSSGAYAIRGSDTSSASNTAGVSGATINGNGISGSVTGTGNGVFGTAPGSGSGVRGNGGLYGVSGFGSGPHSTGVYGASNNATSGVGVEGSSPNVGIAAVSTGTGDPIEAYGSYGHVMSLDGNGNLTVTGAVTAHGAPMIVAGPRNAQRISYSTQSAAPSIEDAGEGRINSGSGYVAFDPALASTLDPREPYTVLVTPEGECHGLYVTGKSLRGFTVRELMGGRSTLAFGYRIVGRPVATNAQRLPEYRGFSK